MKKIFFLIVTSVFFAGCTSSNTFFYKYERGDCLTHKFEDVDSALDLRFEWKKDTLYIHWDETENEEFSGYYLVRTPGESNTCPFYYIGRDYHELITRRSLTYFKDEVASGEEYYYRLCVREKDKEVDCGGVWNVKIY